MDADRVAVIDIGSNSGRILVVRIDEFGHLDVLETEGTPLRLVHDLATSASLSDAVVERTVEALQGFKAIARGAGANAPWWWPPPPCAKPSTARQFVERLRCETGLDIQIITGDAEARYGFLGGAYGVAADNGVLVDIGGGSVQLARFVDRALVQSWSLPLGALRLSDRFLLSDPPTSTELRRLQDYARRTLRDARAPTLGKGEQLVGTGRHPAQPGQARSRPGGDYPDSPPARLCVETTRPGRTVVSRLASQTAAQRVKTPGPEYQPLRLDPGWRGVRAGHSRRHRAPRGCSSRVRGCAKASRWRP